MQRVREYIVTVGKLWGNHISGPVLAVVAIVLPIIALLFTNASDAVKFLNWAAIGTGALAVLLVVAAQYEAWSLERDKYEGEVAKNSRPEIRGEVFGFSVSTSGDGRVHDEIFCGANVDFTLRVCNHRPVPTNFRALVIDGKDCKPPIEFTRVVVLKLGAGIKESPVTHFEMLHGIMTTAVGSAQLMIKGKTLAEVGTVDLSALRVHVMDGFSDAYQIQIPAGEKLVLRADGAET